MKNIKETILALDLGTTTGWAVGGMDKPTTSGTYNFKPHRFEGGGMRYLRFRRFLTELKHVSESIDHICFEEVRRHSSTDAAHVYGGFMAHLTAWAEHYNIPYEGVPVGTIKRFIAGKGNASKAEVIEAVEKRGFHPKDDNEADALALLFYALFYKNTERE